MFKDYQQIVDEMIADYNTRRGRAPDTNVGAIIRTVFQVIAVPLFSLWYALAKLLDSFFVGTSDGQILNLRVREKGIIPHEGTKASGQLILQRSTPAPFGVSLNPGDQFTTLETDPDKRVVVELKNAVELQTGWTQQIVDVEAVEAGEASRLVANTPLRLVGVSIPGIEEVIVADPGFSGGSDAETKEEIRERYYYAVQNPDTGGTAADYVNWARSVPGVTTAICLRRLRGHDTVDVLVSTENGLPTDELLDQVRVEVDKRAPATDDWIVIGPTPKSVSVSVQVTPMQGYSLADITESVRSEVIRYLTGIPIGGVLRITRLGDAILSSKIGDALVVEDYVLTTPSGNIDLADTEAVVVGDVTIT